MPSHRASAVAIAAVLLAGCGSSSHHTSTSSSGSSVASTALGRPINGRGGGFATVIPPGFTDATAQANTPTLHIQYAARARPVGGFATNINVIRNSARVTRISTLTNLELEQLHRQLRKSYDYSPVTSLVVAGAPAQQVNYVASLEGRTLHIRQVFVLHGNVAYTITYTALEHSYRAGQRAFHEVLKGWHWI